MNNDYEEMNMAPRKEFQNNENYEMDMRPASEYQSRKDYEMNMKLVSNYRIREDYEMDMRPKDKKSDDLEAMLELLNAETYSQKEERLKKEEEISRER